MKWLATRHADDNQLPFLLRDTMQDLGATYIKLVQLVGQGTIQSQQNLAQLQAEEEALSVDHVIHHGVLLPAQILSSLQL